MNIRQTIAKMIYPEAFNENFMLKDWVYILIKELRTARGIELGEPGYLRDWAYSIGQLSNVKNT